MMKAILAGLPLAPSGPAEQTFHVRPSGSGPFSFFPSFQQMLALDLSPSSLHSFEAVFKRAGLVLIWQLIYLWVL